MDTDNRHYRRRKDGVKTVGVIVNKNPILIATLGSSPAAPHEPLSMWSLYDHPADCPDKFVARRWEIGRGPEPVPTQDVLVADTLDGLRNQLPPNLFRMPRQEGDDPVILETWL